jgi:hypothetical protein
LCLGTPGTSTCHRRFMVARKARRLRAFGQPRLLLGEPRSVRPRQGHSLTRISAVQITRFGGPEVLGVVYVPEPEAGPGRARPGQARQENLRRLDRRRELRGHAPDRELLSGRAAAAADPGLGVRRHARPRRSARRRAARRRVAAPSVSRPTRGSPGWYPTASPTSRRWPSSSRARRPDTCCVRVRIWPRASRSW